MANESRMLLSLITVTLNAADHLPGLARSIEDQGRLEGVEWIVVDGASTDQTIAVIERHSDVVSRWISEPDCGFYDALNKALGMATGEYYLVLGADDRLAPGALAAITAELKSSPGTDAWCFSVRRGGRILRGLPPTAVRKAAGWMRFISSHSVGMVIRKSLHRKYGLYSLRYPLLADGYFLTKVVDGGVTIKNVDRCVGEFADGGLTSNDNARLAAETWLIQVHLGRNLFVQTSLFLIRVLRMSVRNAFSRNSR